MSPRPDACPHCGGKVVPIAYGYPGRSLLDAADRGDVIRGGCMVADDNPRCRTRHTRN